MNYLSELFVDEEGDLLYGEIVVKNQFENSAQYYSEIIEGVFMLPFDFYVEEGGVSYRYFYTGTDRLDFLSSEIKEI